MNTTTNDRKAGVEVMDKAMGMYISVQGFLGHYGPVVAIVLKLKFSVDKGRN